MNKIKYIAFCIIGVCNVFLGFAQEPKEDSLFNVAVLSVYDNPDYSIKIGKEILAQKPQDEAKQINVLLMISNAYTSKRDFNKALEYMLKAKEVNKTFNDPLQNLKIYNKIAAHYHQLGVNEKALQILDQADEFAQQFTNKDSIRFLMGNSFAIRGFIYRDQLSCDIAIDYLKKAMVEYELTQENEKSLINRSVVNYNLGNCYISLNQFEKAKESFANSFRLAEQAGANSLQAFALKGSAEVSTLESRYEEALAYLKRAETLAKKVGDLVLNRGIYKGMSDNYLALNEGQNYQKYLKKFNDTSRQIRSNERSTIQTLLTENVVEVMEKKSALKQKFGLLFLGVGVLILVLLISLILGQRNFKKHFSVLKKEVKNISIKSK